MGSNGLISLLLGIIGFFAALFIRGEAQSTIVKISIGWISAGFIEFCVYLYENRKRLSIIQTQVFKRNKPIRVTTAYLFRIECNGQYVLIKRHKKDRPGFQPVGGTYKYLKEENRELFDKLGIEPDNYIERDDDTENDLRIVLRKRKKLIEYLKWFESRKNRELDPWREFFEELIESGLLPSEPFKHIKYSFIRKTEEYISPSPVYPIDEFRYADIYELRMETDAQKSAIQNLRYKTDDILFATPEEIRKGDTNNGKIILPHSPKILPKC